jgi:hypothetical protein
MTKKNSKKVSLGHVPMLLLWVVVLGLTVLRLLLACSGSLGETEAFLTLCAAHPAGGYLEGACGVPLLVALALKAKTHMGVSSLLVMRCLSPLAALLLSWTVWWIGRRMAPHRPVVALWSVIGVNFLPWVNLGSLIMDGAIVTASLMLLCVVAGWNTLETTGAKGNGSPSALLPWFLFGLALGFTTLFYYPIAFILPVAFVFRLRLHGLKGFPWKGVLMAFLCMVLGGVVPLIWNARHDWIQWSSVARGFDSYTIFRTNFSLSLLVALSSLLTPGVVLLASTGIWWRRGMALLLVLLGIVSCWVLLAPAQLPLGCPSSMGIQGTADLARALISLQKERPDAKGASSFLIAQSPGLAALLGEKIILCYPERPDAPSVFVAESPSMNSSFALWPGYADAVAPSIKDMLYTEEKVVSPFLGRNALYITTEAQNELPQTITGAFGAVGLLKELPLIKNGQTEIIRIYQCEGYRSLSL